MKELDEYINLRDELDRLLSLKDYEKAFSLCESLVKRYVSSCDLWYIRGLLILKLDFPQDSTARTLDDAYQSLCTSVILSPKNKYANIEAGFFELNINDDPDRALAYFKAARINALEELRQAVEGELKVYVDKKSDISEIAELKSILNIFEGDLDIELILDELGQPTK
ncbi:hypothetical protein BTA51_10110 [Hahella sp. CCB-MM4]|uniref:hypothetical protein n=1 Tax=Hahella sp. (strain CCB-MM4) TaxID=1926491 RepID=UPI000B9AA4DF|nr:hypothetical protein [Hahella sp. CCB-MM4]OZG73373.1 hypothetical protein BTA51_10110 [Hahella sp. CCB-MM4]